MKALRRSRKITKVGVALFSVLADGLKSVDEALEKEEHTFFGKLLGLAVIAMAIFERIKNGLLSGSGVSGTPDHFEFSEAYRDVGEARSDLGDGTQYKVTGGWVHDKTGSDIVVTEGYVVPSVVYGIRYKYHTRRTAMYQNLGNVRPSAAHEGVVGTEIAYRYKGGTKQSVGKFAIFSDPYYSVKAAARTTVASRSEDWFKAHPYSEFRKANAARIALGRPDPGIEKTLYRVMAHYGGFSTEYGDDAYRYAWKIVNCSVVPPDVRKLAWPDDIYTILDLEHNKNQFIAFFAAVFYHEQGTIVSAEYLGAAYEAIYHGARAPLQEYIREGYFDQTTFKEIKVERHTSSNSRPWDYRGSFNLK